MSTPTAPKSDSELLDLLQGLLGRAQQGDADAVPELEAALDANPWIWERYGELARQAQAAWVRLIAGSNLMLRECLERKTAALQAELTGPAPSPLEKLLAGRVVACWLQVHYADAAYAQLATTTTAQHTAALRRQSSAHQRYLQAIKALVTVQRLLRPAPTPLQLLRVPVSETGGENSRHPPGGFRRISTTADN
jgi:hypothetical protein